MIDWHRSRAPDLDEFEALARAAYDALPAAFRALTRGVVIRIEDFASQEVLRDMGLESPFELLGLYQGFDAATRAEGPVGALPDMVFLYRRPLLDVWAEGEETLGHLITHLLVHELGHHFGLSDEDMHRLEESARDEG